MKLLDLVCPRCKKQFKRTVGSYNRSIMRMGTCFCSDSCRLWKPPNRCNFCDKETKNPKFCSTSCSATYNNKNKPKREKADKFCSGCGRSSTRNTKRCKFCRSKKDYASLTLESLSQECGSRNSYSTTVRQHSRFVAEEAGLLNSCRVCGYTCCVECCHIKAVSKFPLSSTLKEVNDKDNLVGLCPNHHWELDHGIINLVPGQGFQPRTSSL